MNTILEAIFSFVISVIELLGYGGIFLLSLLESANIPIPSEVVLPFSGFLAAKGAFVFWWVVAMGTLGNLAGSLVSYGVAHFFGRKPFEFLAKVLLVSWDDLDKAENWFKKYGNASVFFARFVPVVRTFISFPAGMFKVRLAPFVTLTLLGSFVWSWVLTYFGFVLGENWHSLEKYFKQFDYAILALLSLVVIWWTWRHVRQRQEESLKR